MAASPITTTTIVGTIGAVYELRRVGKDKNAVINFSVAVTPRVRDGEGWTDGDPLWHRVVAWGRLAENIEKSFRKGDRVIIIGQMKPKAGYTRDDGTEVPAGMEVTADYAGLDLTWDSASSNREARSGGSKGGERRSSGNGSGGSSSGSARSAKPRQEAPKVDDQDFESLDDFNFDDEDDDF